MTEPEQDDEPCEVCHNVPCDCDEQYDRWADARLDDGHVAIMALIVLAFYITSGALLLAGHYFLTLVLVITAHELSRRHRGQARSAR